MRLLLASPSADDIIHLLKAWRLWFMGALAGALIAALVYLVAPPAFRGRATVNVDFHMERAWPQNSDREQFYYLERETRKLEEIAASDAVFTAVAAQVGGTSLAELRSGKLILSQPGNGGWHFYADDRDPERAGSLASVWAEQFAKAVTDQVLQPSSQLEQYITAQPVQLEHRAVQRTVSMSIYLFAGAVIFLALSAFVVLFIRRPA